MMAQIRLFFYNIYLLIGLFITTLFSVSFFIFFLIFPPDELFQMFILSPCSALFLYFHLFPLFPFSFFYFIFALVPSDLRTFFFISSSPPPPKRKKDVAFSGRGGDYFPPLSFSLLPPIHPFPPLPIIAFFYYYPVFLFPSLLFLPFCLSTFMISHFISLPLPFVVGRGRQGAKFTLQPPQPLPAAPQYRQCRQRQ